MLFLCYIRHPSLHSLSDFSLPSLPVFSLSLLRLCLRQPAVTGLEVSCFCAKISAFLPFTFLFGISFSFLRGRPDRFLSPHPLVSPSLSSHGDARNSGWRSDERRCAQAKLRHASAELWTSGHQGTECPSLHPLWCRSRFLRLRRILPVPRCAPEFVRYRERRSPVPSSLCREAKTVSARIRSRVGGWAHRQSRRRVRPRRHPPPVPAYARSIPSVKEAAWLLFRAPCDGYCSNRLTPGLGDSSLFPFTARKLQCLGCRPLLVCRNNLYSVLRGTELRFGGCEEPVQYRHGTATLFRVVKCRSDTNIRISVARTEFRDSRRPRMDACLSEI